MLSIIDTEIQDFELKELAHRPRPAQGCTEIQDGGLDHHMWQTK